MGKKKAEAPVVEAVEQPVPAAVEPQGPSEAGPMVSIELTEGLAGCTTRTTYANGEFSDITHASPEAAQDYASSFGK